MFLGYRVVMLVVAMSIVQTSLLAQTYQIKNPNQKRKSTKFDASKTNISVELLLPKRVNGLMAQEWARTFSNMGVQCRVRQPLFNDELKIKEQKVGTLRTVVLIGNLNQDGSISFPGKTFAQRDTAKLNEWLRELKTYGAQGTPTGKPVWGLSQKQFEILYVALGKKISEDIVEKPFNDALTSLELPGQYVPRFTATAREYLAKYYAKQPKVKQSVKGFSKGTALAILLNEFGLGFRPLRTPEGNIELSVAPLHQQSDVWPVGWEPKTPFTRLVPKLYQLVPVELKDVKMVDVLTAISVKTEVPVLLNHFQIKKQGIDLEKLTVSYPSRKTSWSRLLRSVSVPNKMTRQYKIDEAGKPFVWITVPERRIKQRKK